MTPLLPAARGCRALRPGYSPSTGSCWWLSLQGTGPWQADATGFAVPATAALCLPHDRPPPCVTKDLQTHLHVPTGLRHPRASQEVLRVYQTKYFLKFCDSHLPALLHKPFCLHFLGDSL